MSGYVKLGQDRAGFVSLIQLSSGLFRLDKVRSGYVR